MSLLNHTIMSPEDLVFLSFCIPTYNRSLRVHELVTSILSCPDTDIEVVVLDNGSTDDTLARLSTIQDSRLHVHINGTNRGALFNMVNVLEKGLGNYLIYSTDQDCMEPKGIPAFKAFLKTHTGVTCGYCSFEDRDSNHQIVSRGYECVSTIAYKGRHPTGYFFGRSALKKIRLVERFSDFDVVDLFPLEFAFAEIGLAGDGAIFHGHLFTPNTGSDVVTHKSSTTVGTSSKAFFAPVARLKLAVSYSAHIDSLSLPESQKSSLIAQVFIRELVASTLGYRAVMGNDKLCIHYGMTSRKVTQWEILRTGAWFLRSYLARRYAGRPARVPAFLRDVLSLLGQKVAARIA